MSKQQKMKGKKMDPNDHKNVAVGFIQDALKNAYKQKSAEKNFIWVDGHAIFLDNPLATDSKNDPRA